MERKIAKILGILGFILFLPIIAVVLVGSSIIGTHISGVIGLVTFLLLTIPATVGFIFSLRANKKPKSSGVLMLICGLLILIPGILTGVLIVGIIPGVLFSLGGLLLLTEKSIKEPK